ncbi:MAG: pyruvate kinase, partial [Clostridium sp.]
PQLLVDLQGPELRTGTVAEPVALRNGDIVEICEISENVKAGRSTKIMLPELILPYLVPGQEVLLDDGKIHLKIVEKAENVTENGGENTQEKRYFAKVLWGGLLKSRKSAALPGAKIYPPTLTNSDLANIKIAKEMGVTGVMQPL